MRLRPTPFWRPSDYRAKPGQDHFLESRGPPHDHQVEVDEQGGALQEGIV